MRMSFVKYIILLLCSFNISTFGQIGVVRFFSISDGLSNNTINTILQDSDGYLWVGTEDGLNMFDGYFFKTYYHSPKDTLSICSNVITGLLQDKKGNLWIATCNGLDTYDKNTDMFIHYNFISYAGEVIKDVDIRAIAKDFNDNIIVYSTNTSPHTYIFNQEKKRFEALFPKTKEIDLALNNIRTIYISENNILWFGSTTNGLFKVDRNNNTFINYKYSNIKQNSLQSNEIYHINKTRNNEILISTSKGLYIYNEKDNDFYPFEKANKEIQKIHSWYTYIDSNNNLWIATEGNGIYIYDIKDKKYRHISTHIKGKKILNNDYVRFIFEDSHNNIWLGTKKGLSYYINPKYIKFNLLKTNIITNNKIDNTTISSIWKDKINNDYIWLGTYNYGLIKYNTKSGNYKILLNNSINSKTKSDNINNIRRISNGELWVGTHRNGIYVLDNKERIKKHFLHNPLDSMSLSNNDVRYIYEDSSNKIWIATNGGGLNLYSKKNDGFTHFIPDYENYSENIVGEWCLGITEDKQNNLWIYSYNGLSIFNQKENIFRNYRNDISNPRSLSNNWVYSVVEDLNGNVWIGTNNGLNLYDKLEDKFNIITTDNGLINNCIKSIIVDNKNNLWLASNKGLTRIKTQNINNTTKIIDIRNFTSDLAIEGNEFIINSVFKDKNNDIYFGGTKGLVYFNSDSIKFNTKKPKIIFEDIIVNYNEENSKKYRKQLFENKTLRFNHKQLVYEFKFVIIDFINSKKNRYKYKLIGFDNQWHYLGYKRDITLIGLSPGDYELVVSGENSIGIETVNKASVKFVVLPPWWLTGWAYAFYSLIILLIIFIIVTEILRKQRLEHQIKIEKIEKQKSEELIQAKISFFTDITHEIRTPLTLIISTIEIALKKIKNKKEQHNINIIYRNSVRLLNLMNQLLDFRKLELGKVSLNIEKINLVTFVNDVISAFEFQYQKKNITLNININIEDDTIWYDKQKLEIILYNIISNAVKYVNENGNISIKFIDLNNENKIKLIVTNTGKGIPAEQISNIFDRFYKGNNNSPNKDSMGAPSMGIGLALTKRYVELHNGNIYVKSIENKSTSFFIEFLKGNKHFKEDVKIIKANSETNYQLTQPDSLYIDVTPKHIIKTDKNRIAKKPTLLIVEDNDEIRELLGDFLSDTFEIQFAEDGEKGLKLANEIIPNVIVCDIMMPGIDGLTLCNKLKNNINTSHIPIILLTAKITTDDQIKGLKCGADDYILKPFNPSVLKLKLTNVIKSLNKIYDKIEKDKTFIPSDITNNSLDEEFIKKAIECVNKNMQNSEFDLIRFSRELGMSERNLQLKFKSLINQSPIEFIRTIRLNKAAELLKERKLNISQITYEIGFNTTSYFTKCFKNQFGMTPTEYVKKQKRNYNEKKN